MPLSAGKFRQVGITCAPVRQGQRCAPGSAAVPAARNKDQLHRSIIRCHPKTGVYTSFFRQALPLDIAVYVVPQPGLEINPGFEL